jgi:hypothetical protein
VDGLDEVTQIEQAGIAAGLTGTYSAHVTGSHGADVLNGRMPTEAQLERVVARDIATDKRIPWSFLPHGCEARAWAVSDDLRKLRINNYRLFAQGFFEAKNQYYDSLWGYHTAAATWVMAPTPDGKGCAPALRVIDFAISDKPLAPLDWLRSFVHAQPFGLELDGPEQYMPSEWTKVRPPYQPWDTSFEAHRSTATQELSADCAELAQREKAGGPPVQTGG